MALISYDTARNLKIIWNGCVGEFCNISPLLKKCREGGLSEDSLVFATDLYSSNMVDCEVISEAKAVEWNIPRRPQRAPAFWCWYAFDIERHSPAVDKPLRNAASSPVLEKHKLCRLLWASCRPIFAQTSKLSNVSHRLHTSYAIIFEGLTSSIKQKKFSNFIRIYKKKKKKTIERRIDET